MDYPPILPTIEEELKQFLLCPENLPIHQYEKNQQFWAREPNPIELLGFEESPQYSSLKVSLLLTIIRFNFNLLHISGEKGCQHR